MSRKSKAVRELFLAFQAIESTTEKIFFEVADDIIGAETTKLSGRPRTVALKNRNGTRITLREDVESHLIHMFWLVPSLNDSKQLTCPYEEGDWETLLEKCRQASKFIPLPPLRFLSPNADDYYDGILKYILKNTLPS